LVKEDFAIHRIVLVFLVLGSRLGSKSLAKMLSKRSEREEIDVGRMRIRGSLVVGLKTKIALAFFVLLEVEW
jgi:coenzyme F420-reducing hydrogenase beta subunit